MNHEDYSCHIDQVKPCRHIQYNIEMKKKIFKVRVTGNKILNLDHALHVKNHSLALHKTV